ncbi:hypothetical protein HZH66_013981 [Vespula vulgaris]|uniref:DUF4817 domain-containing protein n=1 Tax=Vespula vulgaris TaxID=7454 RepID=A0A834MQI0_VESVU|nr:hypothetical protein HZH66_013981 [Vespula vulgaris]
MLLVYGACNKNATRAKIAIAEKYPERNQPLRRMFQRLYHSLLEIESFNVNKRKCNKTIMNETNIVVVLGAVTRNLNISIPKIAKDCTIKVNWNRIPAQIRKLKFLADKKKQCMKKIIPRFLRRRIKDTMFSSFNYTGMNYKNITWWNIMSVKKPEILNYSTNMSSAN